MNNHPFVGIINYPGCNVSSIRNALEFMSIKSKSVNSEDFKKIDALVIPGVGNFGSLSNFLKKQNLENSILEFARTGKPVLGICAGMQILFESSDEAVGEGLGFFSTRILEISSVCSGLRTPLMGWSSLEKVNQSKLKIERNDLFYFSHSFMAPFLKDKYIKYCCTIGNHKIPAVVNHENIFGFQFHPEKSSLQGVELLTKVLSGEV